MSGPFLRFTRDKRGYEHTYLVQATNRRGKPIRPRILYWYRTPPGVRLGRVPFDEEVRKALEAQHPGIVFDWDTLASTSFPAQDPEFWRERRRAERAAKQARREEEGAVREEAGAAPAGEDDAPLSGETEAGESGLVAVDGAGPSAPSEGSPRKRRRRGGKRRRGRTTPGEAGEGDTPDTATSAEGQELAAGDGDGGALPSVEADFASEDQE